MMRTMASLRSVSLLALLCVFMQTRVHSIQQMKVLKPGEPGIEQKMYFDSPYEAKVNVSLGEGCFSSNECASGCCVIERRRQVCKSLAHLNQLCSTGQVKGGFYPKYCPCADDNHICRRTKGRSRSSPVCTAPAEITTTLYRNIP